MTENAWKKEKTWPYSLVASFRGTSVTRTKVGRRKLRLFACGCCRLIWPYIADTRLKSAIEVTERFADGQATAAELKASRTTADLVDGSWDVRDDDPNAQAHTVAALVNWATEAKPYSAAVGVTLYPLPSAGYRGSRQEADSLLCDLLRDIFGNPFRPVAFSPEWRSDTAVSLAKHMYESRDFSAMPILADALQDAGCDNEDVLNHCRDEKPLGGMGAIPPCNPHVRGCWVVDLVLGKE